MFAQMSFSEQRVAGCETFLQAGSFPAEELKIDLCKCTRMASGISFRKNSKRLLVSYNWLFLSTLSQLDRVLMRKTAFKDGPVSWEWWWQRHSCRSLLHSSLTHTHTRAYPSAQYPLISSPIILLFLSLPPSWSSSIPLLSFAPFPAQLLAIRAGSDHDPSSQSVFRLNKLFCVMCPLWPKTSRMFLRCYIF